MQNNAENVTERPLIYPYNIAADSHVGLIRESNEDSYAYLTDGKSPGVIVAVADGIGGHENGNLASRACIQNLITSWKNKNMHLQNNQESVTTFLRDEILASNDSIYALNEKYEIQHPMGTTVVAGVLLPDAVVLAHSGDSRCYRVRNGAIEQLTQDHSFVAELLRKEVITPEEALHHPFAHIISRSVGPIPGIEPEITLYDREIGDRFIFCSDGLTNHIDDHELEMIIDDSTDPYMAVKNMLKTALRGGGEDNITIVCVFA